MSNASSARAVQEAQVTVPADTDEIDEKNAVVKGDELEVDELHGWPDVIIGLQGGQVALLELLLG